MHLNRRQFLGGATAATGATFGAALAGWPFIKEFVSGLTDSPEVKPSKDELNKVLMGEYACIWHMRPAVLINNLIGCTRLDRMFFPTGVEFSLAQNLGLFDGNFHGFNFDAENCEYVGDLHFALDKPAVSVIEAGGLSFTATMLARAGLSAPVNFVEWHTHTNIPEHGLLPDYFDPSRIIAPSSIQRQLTKWGTDATVFVADDNLWDLRFIPQEDLILKYTLQALRKDGAYQTVTIEDAENSDDLFDWLTNSATKISSVQVRALATLQPVSKHHPYYVSMVNTERNGIPGFRRDLYYNGRIIRNEFYAHYDTSGNFVG